MRICLFLLAVVFLAINIGCRGSHAIQCAMVGSQKICFVREVWGRDGEQVSLTISDNVCHQPSEKYDYVAKGVGQDKIYAKNADGKFYIYSKYLYAPENRFPVEVVFEEYNPLTHFDRDFIKEGYQEFDLSQNKMMWCFDDIF